MQIESAKDFVKESKTQRLFSTGTDFEARSKMETELEKN